MHLETLSRPTVKLDIPQTCQNCSASKLAYDVFSQMATTFEMALTSHKDSAEKFSRANKSALNSVDLSNNTPRSHNINNYVLEVPKDWAVNPFSFSYTWRRNGYAGESEHISLANGFKIVDPEQNGMLFYTHLPQLDGGPSAPEFLNAVAKQNQIVFLPSTFKDHKETGDKSHPDYIHIEQGTFIDPLRGEGVWQLKVIHDLFTPDHKHFSGYTLLLTLSYEQAEAQSFFSKTEGYLRKK
jgi:hypothetical protein